MSTTSTRPWLTCYGMDEGRDEFDAWETWLEERSAPLLAALLDEGIELRVDLFAIMCDLADRQAPPAAEIKIRRDDTGRIRSVVQGDVTFVMHGEDFASLQYGDERFRLTIHDGELYALTEDDGFKEVFVPDLNAARQTAPAVDPWPGVPEPLVLWCKRGPEYAYGGLDHDQTRRTINALIACVADLQRRLGKEEK